jgi:MATE family multidrug resistance protein
LYLGAPDALAALFHSEKETTRWHQVAEVVPVLLRFVAVYSIFDSMNLVFSSALRGAGDTRFVFAAAVSLAWPVMVLPTWLIIHNRGGLEWAWTFASLYIIVLALVYWARFLQGKWQAMRVIEQIPGST